MQRIHHGSTLIVPGWITLAVILGGAGFALPFLTSAAYGSIHSSSSTSSLVYLALDGNSSSPFYLVNGAQMTITASISNGTPNCDYSVQLTVNGGSVPAVLTIHLYTLDDGNGNVTVEFPGLFKCGSGTCDTNHLGTNEPTAQREVDAQFTCAGERSAPGHGYDSGTVEFPYTISRPVPGTYLTPISPDGRMVGTCDPGYLCHVTVPNGSTVYIQVWIPYVLLATGGISINGSPVPGVSWGPTGATSGGVCCFVNFYLTFTTGVPPVSFVVTATSPLLMCESGPFPIGSVSFHFCPYLFHPLTVTIT